MPFPLFLFASHHRYILLIRKGCGTVGNDYKVEALLICGREMIEGKLNELGLELPALSAPAASYVGFKIWGNTLVVSGQLPLKEGKPTLIGKLGDNVSIEDGYIAAQQCALNILAQAKAALRGDWSRIVQVVRLGGFVNCVPAFTDAPKVVNGASDLMVKVFGNSGSHARAAVGVASLPSGVAVEVEATFEIRV